MEMVRGKEKEKGYGFTQGIWVFSLSQRMSTINSHKGSQSAL